MTNILAVCTGNVCRSPATERLLGSRLGPAANVEVHSAGTSALVGAPIDGPVAELLREAGVDPTDFTARRLVPEHVRAADLVLVMTREHRSAVVAVEPAAVRRTLLLREAAVLATAITREGWPIDVSGEAAARLAALPRLAGRHRPDIARMSDLEVEDPYQRSTDVYQRSVAVITEAVDALAAALVG